MDNTEHERIKKLAHCIATQIAGERDTAGANAGTDEVAVLRSNLAEMQRRLEHIESRTDGGVRERGAMSETNGNARKPQSTTSENGEVDRTMARSPWLFGGGTYVSAVHPSEQRFGINEAVTELVDYFEAGKTCELEPGGKPCDHCGMCSARGF